MRLHILSDLHHEHGTRPLQPADADVLVLAGDIGTGTRGLDSVADLRSSYRAAIYVAGNHEYYGHALPRLVEKLRQRGRELDIHLLHDEAITIDGVHFLGCTLWTDFEVGAPEVSRAAAIAAAESSMADFGSIRVSPAYRRLRSSDLLQMHHASRAWLDTELAERTDAPCVVITHHAPLSHSIAPRHRDSPLNGAFASDLQELIARHDIELWIHGHTHHCVDYELGGTRIVSNQRGYPGEDTGPFDPQFVVDIDPAATRP